MTLEMGILTPHTPRMCHEDQVPEFQMDLLHGMKKVAKQIDQINPDTIVMISCHWVSSFNHLIDATPRHKGVLTAFECPELISDVPYDYPGDEELATELVEAGKKLDVPIIKVNDPTYVWDYGTVVPLRYLVPKENIPIVDISVTLAANLEETYQLGLKIGEALQKSDKRTIFMSSGALSHNLVRGPEIMPTRAEQTLDNQFIEYLENGKLDFAYDMLPQYSRTAGVESGGRHLAMLLGVLSQPEYKGTNLGYGQSSGSGNIIMTFESKEATMKQAI